jgi:hypothetical protein
VEEMIDAVPEMTKAVADRFGTNQITFVGNFKGFSGPSKMAAEGNYSFALFFLPGVTKRSAVKKMLTWSRVFVLQSTPLCFRCRMSLRH